MAYLSKHTWYTTFRRQCFVLFCFVLPSIFVRRSWGGRKGGPHPVAQGQMPPQHTPSHQAWRPMKRAWEWLQRKGPQRLGFCSVGAQNWNKGVPRTWEGASRDLPSGVMEWSWLGIRIHAENLPGGHQEWPKCILQEGFCSNSYTVVDTKLHMALPSFDPQGVWYGSPRPYINSAQLSAGSLQLLQMTWLPWDNG